MLELTQDRLAEALALSIRSLKRYEAGGMEPKLDIKLEIRAGLQQLGLAAAVKTGSPSERLFKEVGLL